MKENLHGIDKPTEGNVPEYLKYWKPKFRPHPDEFCGCYLLSQMNTVVYVGQSKKIMDRILSHRDKEYNSWDYILCEEHELDTMEAELIAHYKPIYNKVLPVASGYNLLSVIVKRMQDNKMSMVELPDMMKKTPPIILNGKTYFKASDFNVGLAL